MLKGPGRAIGAQQQSLSRRQRRADGGLGPAARRQQLVGGPRHGALRPHDNVGASGGGAGCEIQVAAEDRAEIVFVVLGFLLHIGLDDADYRRGRIRRRERALQPQGAPSP